MPHKLVTLILDGDLATQGFRVAVEIGPEGQQPDASVTGTLPVQPTLREELRAWQQHYRQLDAPARIRPKEIVYVGSLQPLKACQRAAQTLQQQFNQWLQAESFRPIDRLLREELSREDEIRFVVRTADQELYHLPWHRWDFLDRYTQAEVVLSAPHFKRPEPLTPPVASPVKVLAILGHSAGIDVSRDRALLAALPHAQVTFLVEPQRQDITDQLWEQPWDMLFFAGHSESREATGHIFINPQESLTLEELQYGLRRAIASGLQLAIFNSCDGLGLATGLATIGLPHLIVMRQPVPDRIAHLFLTYLLPPYAAGESLPLALRHARERLQGVEAEFPCASWLPVLYQTVPDPPPTWTQLQQPPAIAPAPSGERVPRGRWRAPLFASLVVSALVLGVRVLGGWQPWELQAYDRLLQQRLPQPTPERLLVIAATEEDVNRYGYPLPDVVLAQVIDRLAPYRPRVIGLDIFRDRLDANSPLATQLAQQENLVGLCSVRVSQQGNQSGIAPPAALPVERLGFSNVVEDPDGVMRRHLLFMTPAQTDPCATPFALSTLLALQYLQAEGIVPENLPRDRLRLGQTTFVPLEAHAGPYRQVDHWGFQVWLNYAEPDQLARQVSLSEVLAADFAPGSLTNHVVLIGLSAPISNPTDYFLTPEGAHQWPRQQIPGVLLHAQMVNHLLAAALDGRSPLTTWPEWGEMLWILGWCGVGGCIGGYCQRWRLGLWVLGGAVLGLYGLAWGLLNIHVWVPLVPTVVGLIGTYGGTTGLMHCVPFHHNRRLSTWDE